jgi:hypothetical protein
MTRLLTLTGIGGSGKARLALAVARDLIGTYPDGVRLVELAPLAEGALAPQTMAKALDVSKQADRSIADTLVDTLKDKKSLLVLDNCEHLVDACAGLVELLLSSCPDLQILATGREALGVAGEAGKISPILAFQVEDGAEQAAARCLEVLAYGGIGHITGIHTRSHRATSAFGKRMSASRVVVNTSTAHGAMGFSTALESSLTLGCGSWGNNIISDNISPLHLMDIKRLVFETQPIGGVAVPRLIAVAPEPRVAA